MTDLDFRAQQQRIHAALPVDMQDLYRDAPRDDNRLAQVSWLGKSIRKAIQDHVVVCVFDALEYDIEVVRLAVSIIARLSWPNHIVDSAIVSEKRIATAAATALLDRIEKRVRTLAYERAQGSRIIREAQAIADQSGLFVPSPFILQTVQRIVQAVAGASRARRG